MERILRNPDSCYLYHAMKTFFGSLAILSTILVIVFIGSAPQTGCSPDRSNLDTIPSPPPPPVPDTVTYVKTLEEKFGNTINRRFSFFYDAQKRVIQIGIKHYYSNNITDSFSTRFFYSGNNKHPYQVIRPSTQFSQPGSPTYYDTIWITYNSSGLPVKDSSTDVVYNNTTNQPAYKPLLRYYSYPDNNTVFTEWYGSTDAGNGNLLVRKDTIVLNTTNGVLQKSSSKFLVGLHAVGKAENFTASSFVNPLGKLNISGSITSFIYSPTRNEILGNSFHPAVWNSNTLPSYIDFINQLLPSQFYFSAYEPDGSLAGAAQSMNLQISPWLARDTYPASITVVMAGSLPGTTPTYSYSYY